MPDIRAQFPLKGINEGEAYTGQPPATTREAVNVQGNDPVSGRNRGAQRSGISLYNTAQLNGANKVADLSHVVYDSGKTTWSQRSELITDSEWQNALPSGGDCFELALDRQNNVYSVDGTASVVKYNSAGVKVYSLSVPVTDLQHEIRCLAVDPSDYIFCGVSQGGDQNTAKIFAYEQIDSSTNNRIWDLTVGLYAKRLVVNNGLLYCAFDDAIRRRSYIHVYDAIQSAVPLLKAKWEVPYPINDLCISGADGGLATAHEPNSLRGISPTSPGTTASSIDWTPNKLPDFDKRVWCWLDATDIDGDGSNNSDYENGEEVLTWYDKSGNNRHLYRNIDAINATTLIADSGPTLLKGSVAGRDACSFNGTNQSLMSGGGVSSSSNYTTQQLRAQNLTLWPSEAGSQFALFAVIRAPQDEVIRVLFSQDELATHDYNKCRAMCLNRNPCATSLLQNNATALYHTEYGPAQMLGSVCWAEQAGVSTNWQAPYTAPSIQPSGSRETASTIAMSVGTVTNTVGFRPAAGSSPSDYTLITLIHNGGSLTNTGDAVGDYRSRLYINGIPADNWTSRADFASLMPVYLGWTKATPAANTEYRFRGLVCEVLVFSDWYEAPLSPFESSIRRYPIQCTPDGNSSGMANVRSFTESGEQYSTPSSSTYAKSGYGWEAKQVEGYLAHKWGLAHLLPSGLISSLQVTSRILGSPTPTNPAAGNTIAIDDSYQDANATKTYTFRATLTAAANDVLIGASTYATLLNLYYAVNGTSKSGSSYSSATTPARTLIAYPPVAIATGAGTGNAKYFMRFQAKSNLKTEGVGYSEGFASLGAIWVWHQPTAGVYYWEEDSNQSTGAGNGIPQLWLPHPFYLNRPFKNNYTLNATTVSNTVTSSGCSINIIGGPPRADGRKLSTPYQVFSNGNGLVCKWDPSSGSLKWALASRLNGDELSTYGGVGYGLVSNSNGLLCSVGPVQPTVLLTPTEYAASREVQGGVYGENTTTRTILDKKETFSVDSADAWKKFTEPTATANSFESPDYKSVRLASDAFGNFYAPWCDNEGNASRYCLYTLTYKSDTALGGGSPILHRYSGLKTAVNYAPRGMCVAVTQDKPDYTDSGILEADSQAEYVFVGLKNENACVITSSGTAPANASTVVLSYAGSSYTYTFKTGALTAANDVAVGASAASAMTNLARAISLTGSIGSDYHSSTVVNPTFGAKTILTGSTVTGVVIQVKASVKRSDVITPFTISFGGTTNLSNTAPNYYDENIRRIKQVDAALATGTTRRFKTIGISGGSIKEFDNLSTVTSVTGTGFTSSSSDFYQSAVLFQKVYITNGQEVVVYNPKKASSELLKATTAGEVPKRCKLIASWRSRLVLARPSDSPHNWFMSAIGDPTDWDLFPKVVNSGQAIAGTISKAGLVPDTINALVPYNDDLMIIGGDHSIYRLTGDPMAGGQMDLLTDVTGMAFGQSWDKDPQGNLYFLSPRGQLYMIRPGRNGMLEVTGNRFEQRMADIDLTNNYVRLVWNDLERQLHIFVMPFGSGGTHLKHFRYERNNDAFWQDEFGTTTGTDVQPTSAIVVDADDPADRTLLLGGEDGRVRRWDKNSRNDQRTTSTTYPIDSQVVMGPYGLPDAEIRLTKLQAVMASDQQRANIQIFASDAPDSMGTMVWSGTLMPGRNPNIFARAKGSYFWIRIRNAWADERWSFENMSLTVAKAGRKRVRP